MHGSDGWNSAHTVPGVRGGHAPAREKHQQVVPALKAAGKTVNGRKRRLLVDTLGLIHGLVVHPAAVQDRDGVKLALKQVKDRMARLERVWADDGYQGALVGWVAEETGWILEIVTRPEGVEGFVVAAHRWVVERTFAWLAQGRRFRAAHATTVTGGEALIRPAMIGVMLRRLCRN